MRQLAKALAAAALLCAAIAPAAAQADFGFEHIDIALTGPDGSPSMQAGSHPFAFTTRLDFNVDGSGQPEGSPKDLEVDLPPGFVAEPTAVPRCSTTDFLTLHQGGPLGFTPSCPDSSALGFIAVRSPNETTYGDFGAAYNDSAPGAGCPNASKIGTLHAEEPIDGSIFLAQQDDAATTTPGAENPFDSLIAVYFVLKNPNLGAIAKLAVKIEPDPKTGQLVATLDDIPQFPLSQLQPLQHALDQSRWRTGHDQVLLDPASGGDRI